MIHSIIKMNSMQSKNFIKLFSTSTALALVYQINVLQNNRVTFLSSCFPLIVILYKIAKQPLQKHCFILSNVFFCISAIKKLTQEKHARSSYVARERCLNTYLSLPSWYINNVIEVKRPQVKNTKASGDS